MNDAILFTVDEGLARLTLNRPSRLNAFNSDLAHAWRDATAEATPRSAPAVMSSRWRRRWDRVTR